MNNEWDEAGITEADIAVAQQDEIAVYRNEGGSVVIRQRGCLEDDQVIYVAVGNAHRLCDAIQRAAAEIIDDQHEEPSTRPLTAAERKRRQRERERRCHDAGHEGREPDVTFRDRERDERDTFEHPPADNSNFEEDAAQAR